VPFGRIPRSARVRAGVCCLLGLLIVAVPQGRSAAWAQRRQPGRLGRTPIAQPGADDDTPDEQTADSVFYPPDRETLQKLSLARDLIKDKRYGEAARFLSSILESPEDFFFKPDRNLPEYRSLKQEAQRLLGEMGGEGRASYELQYGAQARLLLDDAVERGSMEALADVSRKFFHTEAGYEATYLFALSQMRQGQPLAAALALERLSGTTARDRFDPGLSINLAICWARADRAKHAASLLAELRRRLPDATFEYAGQQLKLFASGAQAEAWLREVARSGGGDDVAAGSPQWTMYRGNSSRNAASIGSSPLLNRRWAVPVADHPNAEQILTKVMEEHQEEGGRLLPGLHLLAARDFVFMRSLTGVMGVDFQTGKRVWGPTESDVGDILDAASQAGRGPASLARWLEERVWNNAVYGTMSSDGDYVYCVNDAVKKDRSPEVDLVELPAQRQFLFNNRQLMGQPAARKYNCLTAYEIASEGKTAWEIDTQPDERRDAWVGAFFLGPPLPLAGRLYVLAETNGEIRLYVLDPKRQLDPSTMGEIEWSQQLAVLEPNPVEDQLRRLAGATPSYSDGILICPTSAGAVVALDLTTRSLLWGYQYQRAAEMLAANARLMWPPRGVPQFVGDNDAERWTDATVTIAEGHVLLTPPEANELYCLNLTDGKLLWHKSRDDGIYVACVHDGKAIVVGNRSVRALRLSDGGAAWSNTSLASAAGGTGGSTPSGRGFHNGDRYYLPLSSAEVATVDLRSGQIVARSRSRSGAVPGNLICYHGAVISQGPDSVESFYQLDELREQVAAALNEHPDDPQALARRGELFLNEGRFQDAVADLRHSFELNADPRTRELLVDSMLEALRLDFAARRESLPELKRLVELPQERAALERLTAQGLQETGETLPAFEAYLRMVDLAQTPDSLERVDSGLAVRRDRWVRARLSELYASAGADDRRSIDAALAERLRDCRERTDVAAYQRFVEYFGELPVADEARQLLAERLRESKSWLEAERWLRAMESSGDGDRARAATALLVRLLVDAGRGADATRYYRELAGRWADDVCLDGRTGGELAAEIAAHADWKRILAEGDAWPQGKVEKHEDQGHNALMAMPVELRGPPGPFFAEATIEFDANPRQSVFGRDGWGREQWRLGLRDRDMANQGFNASVNYARADGHLVVLSLGYQLIGIDTLGTPNAGARVLWKQELAEPVAGAPRQLMINAQRMAFPGGVQRFQQVDTSGRALGNTSPVLAGTLCFQRMRTLVAIDAFTGEMVWTRQDIPAGCELFGDDELLFVAPPNSGEAMVFRVTDGADLGRRELPTDEERLLAHGRNLLVWEPRGQQGTLRWFDVWKQQDRWRKEFEQQAKLEVVGEQAVAVMRPNGHLTVLSLPDGEPTIDARLERQPNLERVFLLRSPEVDVVVTSRQVRQRQVMPMLGPVGATAVVSGHVYGFDRRTGEKLYGRPIQNKGLMLNQPARVPVVVFATNEPRQNGQQSLRGDLLCLDRRNGRFLLDQSAPQPIQGIPHVSGDPAKHEVLVQTSSRTWRLEFTDAPVAEGDDGPKKSRASAVGGAILRGLQRQFDQPGIEDGENGETEGEPADDK
jgi:outer membrane protein assembly factor BamB/tetratricopeptide (TPR) repeat protein